MNLNCMVSLIFSSSLALILRSFLVREDFFAIGVFAICLVSFGFISAPLLDLSTKPEAQILVPEGSVAK